MRRRNNSSIFFDIFHRRLTSHLFLQSIGIFLSLDILRIFLLTYFRIDEDIDCIISIFNNIDEKHQIKNVCWIFNEKSLYQVLISFGSIIQCNPGQQFIFYLIIPPKTKLDTKFFTALLRYNSKIIVRHYKKRHAYLPQFSNLECKWPGIIIVKLWLYEILPEVDQVLYLDTDVVNIRPISKFWEIDLKGKTLAGVPRFAVGYRWINSGVIMYNLKNLRKRDESLWECADQSTCVIDDQWHTTCNNPEWVIDLPYRYNVDFDGMKMDERSKLQIREESRAIFFHLKDFGQEFYSVRNKYDIPDMYVASNNEEVIHVLEKLYSLKRVIDFQLMKASFHR